MDRTVRAPTISHMHGTEPTRPNRGREAASERRGAPRLGRWQLSLRQTMVIVLVAALAAGYATTWYQLRQAQAELARLRAETGYLPPTGSGQIAAVRLFSDEPLTYRFRVRVPPSPPHRVVYSTVQPKDSPTPHWFAGVDLPPGESIVTVRLGEDPRDERWKITTLVHSDRGTKRVATALLPSHVAIFRRCNDAVRAGLGRDPRRVAISEPIRLLEERLLVGEGGLLLYGDKPPEEDQIGVFAELQPDTKPL